MSEELEDCPFCGAKSFEEISCAIPIVKIEEQKFDRINHKPGCWMNYHGKEFERFAKHNIKDVDRKYTPDEDRQRWNRRAK